MSYGPATMHSELRQKPFTNFAHVHLDLLEGGAGGRLSPDAMRTCQNFCIDTRTSIRNDLAMLQPSHASPISNCQATLLLPQNRCAGFSMMAAKPSRRGGCRLLKGELRAFFLIGPREPLLSFLATHNLSIPLTDPFPNQVLLQPHWRKEMTTRSPQPRWSRETDPGRSTGPAAAAAPKTWTPVGRTGRGQLHFAQLSRSDRQSRLLALAATELVRQRHRLLHARAGPLLP